MSDINAKHWDPAEIIEKVLVPKALRKMSELMDSDNEKIATEVAQDVLDRNPATSRKNAMIENRSINVMNFDPNYLLKAAQAAKEVLAGFSQASEVDEGSE